MNVLVLVTTLKRTSGGPAVTIPSLYSHLSDLGVRSTVITTKDSPSDPQINLNHPLIKKIEIQNKNFISNYLLKPSFSNTVDKISKDEKITIFHCNEIWLLNKHLFVNLALKRKIPFVVTPHGALMKWCFKQKYFKKKIAWYLYQKSDIKNASALHVASMAELEDLRSLGLRNPIALIPHGVEGPSKTKEQKKKNKNKRALFLSRLHPQKGIENLIDAWSEVRPKGWELIFVGPDEFEYSKKMKQKIEKYQIQNYVKILGPIYGEEKWDMYQSSDLFILPSFSENFSFSIAEALSCGLPVITTQGTPWKEIETNKCGWWIPIGEKPLAIALREATEICEKDFYLMGKRAKKLVKENYSWDSSARKMKKLYNWILGLEGKPDFVFLPENST